jgi:hypothetical protein
VRLVGNALVTASGWHNGTGGLIQVGFGRLDDQRALNLFWQLICQDIDLVDRRRLGQ